jgi:hypothetical protein
MRAILTILGGASLSEFAIWHFAQIGSCGPINWAGAVLFAAMIPMNALPGSLQTSSIAVALVIFSVFACVWAVPILAVVGVRTVLRRAPSARPGINQSPPN